MPRKKIKTKIATKKPKRKYAKRVKRKGITLDSLEFRTYEEITGGIRKKIGERVPFPKDLPRGNWSEQALRVLKERYLVKNSKGKVIETPGDMCWRVAWEIASAEAVWGKGKREVKKIAEEFYRLLVSGEFLPNSPTLMNAGTGNVLQYSGCFVLPVEDSIEGIFDALKYQALIHQSGGGTGFAFSRLRPHGSMVKSSSGIASGPISFMRIFDAATNEVKQGGKRRGANMGILRVDHPDIIEFIHCKEEGGLTNFNISVTITDQFMRAYERDTDFFLIDPRDGKKVGKLNARHVFDQIAEGAWKTGDPGLVFIERINKGTANPVPSIGPIESTNPCGEQPLYPFDACNLGSIFLNYFVKTEGGKKKVDWEKLTEVTRLAVRFLDNVIEVNPYPLAAIRQTVHAIRRIGLGVGGWADMLIELGIPYDSEEALKLGRKVIKTIQDEAVSTTQDLAEERGPFPLWSQSIYKDKKPRRNSTVTTIAPTGTISIIAGASSGIEPLFAIAFQHIVKDKHLDRTLSFVNPHFEQTMKKRGLWSEGIKEKVSEDGILGNMEGIPDEIKRRFRTAHEIHHDWHIRMQAAFQKNSENAVSKTINMKNTVSVDEIKKAYLLAWKTGCKGITVFRDGSKDVQVLNLGIKNQKNGGKVDGEVLQRRPLRVTGATYKLETPVGVAFITINENQIKEPLEVFINVGKAGSDVAAMAEALGRTISATLRFSGDLSPKERAREIVQQLSGIGGRRAVGFGPKKIRSLPDAVAVALANHYGFQINGNGLSKEASQNGAGATPKVAKPASGVGVKLDLAGAVVKAQTPGADGDGESRVMRDSDHTMASAESNSTSVSRDALTKTAGVEAIQEDSQQLSLSATGDICPSCGSSTLVYEEGCSKCYACGYSEC